MLEDDDDDGKKHYSQKSHGELAKRHAAVLLARDPVELEAAYDKWAAGYDNDLAELSGNGYNMPGVTAARVLIRMFTPESSPALLDFGCGTGAAGPILNNAGWKKDHLHGTDLSQGMLDQAKKRNCYSKLTKSEFGQPGVDLNGSYDIIHAAGVFAPGQAPASTFDMFLGILKTGGHAVFTVRKEYYDSDGEGAGGHKSRLECLVREGKWQQISCTEESYLPKDNVTAYVFVMKKL